MLRSSPSLSWLFHPGVRVLAGCLLAFATGCEDDDIPEPAERNILLIGNTRGDSVSRVDVLTGEILEDFIPDDGPGGLVAPDALVVGPGGDLYVSSGDAPENSVVARYDGITGRFESDFASTRGLVRPYGLAFGPDGLLYVSSFLTDRILRFNALTGSFIDVFATGNGQPGGLNGPNGLAFGPDGALYVTTQGSVAVDGQPTFPGLPSEVLRFNTTTGESEVFIGQPELSPAGLGYISLLGLAFGPDCGPSRSDCDLFVSDFANDIRRYDLATRGLEATLSTNFTGTVPSGNNLGGITFDEVGRLYAVGFESTSLRGAVLRFDGHTNAPLPSEGNSGAIFIPPTERLTRPVGVLYTRQFE